MDVVLIAVISAVCVLLCFVVSCIRRRKRDREFLIDMEALVF